MNKKIKILHLEDSLKDSELIRSLIESGGIGHDYFFAENEKDYLKILEKENIDLILSDYSLPDYNGSEALKVAREKYSYIPFIFVSGTIGEDSAINAMLNGATDYVLKNRLERLVPAIKRALHEYELEIKRKQAEFDLKESEQNLRKQNTDYVNLNKEYSILNEELTVSLEHIQNINDELISAKVKADESDKLKSAFLANMSHEIRTPMNAIMGFSGFLLQPGLSKEKLEDFVQIINASSLQLLSVISDIIDISKIEAGQITVDSELVNINNLLNELFVTYKKIVELKKLSLYYTCGRPNDLIQIKTDGNRIKQVICNLLNNAIKFTKEGKIKFGYIIKKNFIEFYVKDTGMGIAPENQALIFQRFRQIETADSQIYSGNGLGLSISKALVEKLGGTITVNSRLGNGSIFTFTIPYMQEISNTVGPLLTDKSSRFINWNEKAILIVEDEINNHAYIEELLSVTNVKMFHAWDGIEAVEHVKKHADISLVLMDIKLPIMDGFEATRLIKQIRPELPVIAQTAYALSHDKAKVLQSGFDSYISKPITKVAFVELIGSYLNLPG
jgi:signal transduction histidine kinase